MNDQQLLQYYQHQQTQSGWFSLIHVMIESMVANVGEAQINARLAAFNWGYIDIDASETAIRIAHTALPIPPEESKQMAWNHAFSAVLEGLYARWLREQGGKSHVSLWREASPSATVIHFRYQNNQ